MIFDTHAHLNFSEFEKDREDLVKKCLESGIGMINVGTNYNSSKKAVDLAEKYPNGIYASTGLHPLNIELDSLESREDSHKTENLLEKTFDYDHYKELARSKKVVAIGEIGLDYWHRPKGTLKKELFKQKQKDIFARQVDLAKELNLPVIIHCRDAFDDLWDILKDRHIKGVLHCFTGDWQEAERFLSIGMDIGINGIIFKMDLVNVIEKLPLEKALIETDCPYLPPPGFGERNSPLALEMIIKEISRIKKVDIKSIEEITSKNAVNLFKLS